MNTRAEGKKGSRHRHLPPFFPCLLPADRFVCSLSQHISLTPLLPTIFGLFPSFSSHFLVLFLSDFNVFLLFPLRFPRYFAFRNPKAKVPCDCTNRSLSLEIFCVCPVSQIPLIFLRSNFSDSFEYLSLPSIQLRLEFSILLVHTF